MKLSTPKQITFWVAVALAALGLIGYLFELGFLSGLAFWLVLIGFIVLLLGNLLPNL